MADVARTPTAARNRRSGLLVVGGTGALMWVSETVDLVVGELDSLGIEPRSVDGLSCTPDSGTCWRTPCRSSWSRSARWAAC